MESSISMYLERIKEQASKIKGSHAGYIFPFRFVFRTFEEDLKISKYLNL